MKLLGVVGLFALPMALAAEEAAWRVHRGSDGIERCYVPSRRITLPYKVLEPGSAPLAGLRLYVSRDRGKTWSDPALSAPSAPVAFEAPEDGEYGLSVSAVDAAGNAEPGPAAGEAPQLTVVVDTRPPSASLEAPVEAPPGSALSLRWRAEDGCGVDSVRLEASLDEGLHWQAVAKGGATGEAAWTPPSGTAGAVLVRAVARDLAGSRATSEPVRIRIAEGAMPSELPPPPQPPPLEPVLPTADPEAALTHFKAAGIHRMNGRTVEAEIEYRLALAADPALASARNDLGILLFRSDPMGGLSQLEEANRLMPKDPDIAFNLGYALLRARRPAEATGHLKSAAEGRALAGSGSFEEAAYYLALALAGDARYAEALESLQQSGGGEDAWAGRREVLVRELKRAMKRRSP